MHWSQWGNWQVTEGEMGKTDGKYLYLPEQYGKCKWKQDRISSHSDWQNLYFEGTLLENFEEMAVLCHAGRGKERYLNSPFGGREGPHQLHILREALGLCLLPVTISMHTISAHTANQKLSFSFCVCRHRSVHGSPLETPTWNIMSH